MCGTQGIYVKYSGLLKNVLIINIVPFKSQVPYCRNLANLKDHDISNPGVRPVQINRPIEIQIKVNDHVAFLFRLVSHLILMSNA